MTKRAKEIFLFIIPTLIATLCFVPLSNQQNIFASEDCDSPIVKIDNPDSYTKHIVNITNIFTINPSGTHSSIILTACGNTPIFLPTSNNYVKTYKTKSRSPPLNIIF